MLNENLLLDGLRMTMGRIGGQPEAARTRKPAASREKKAKPHPLHPELV
jgi:hypothetical protein